MKNHLLFHLALFALAGCVTPGDSVVADEHQSVAGEPMSEVLSYYRNSTIAAINPIGGLGYVFLDFPMKRTTEWVEVELTWQDPTVDLDVILNGKVDCIDTDQPNDCSFNVRFTELGEDIPGHWRNRNGTYGNPDSPSRLFIGAQEIQDTYRACARADINNRIDCYEWTAGVGTSTQNVGFDIPWQLVVRTSTPISP